MANGDGTLGRVRRFAKAQCGLVALMRFEEILGSNPPQEAANETGWRRPKHVWNRAKKRLKLPPDFSLLLPHHLTHPVSVVQFRV